MFFLLPSLTSAEAWTRVKYEALQQKEKGLDGFNKCHKNNSAFFGCFPFFKRMFWHLTGQIEGLKLSFLFLQPSHEIDIPKHLLMDSVCSIHTWEQRIKKDY